MIYIALKRMDHSSCIIEYCCFIFNSLIPNSPLNMCKYVFVFILTIFIYDILVITAIFN